MPTIDEIIKNASDITKRIDADIYLYNGPIHRVDDLSCIETVSEHVGRDKVILVLVTGGGDPDAAYKISRYLQERYNHFTVLVSGFCKSAGTLIALGAHELAFMPFGELGPLDIQLGKVDKFDAPESGLAIQEALETLEARARRSFDRLIADYMQDNGGLLSFPAASHAASDFVTNLYAPIFARIDPEEVGARSRSMDIAHEYGKRLAVGSRNLKSNTLETLAEKYPSHSFVIDRREAESLFVNVRAASGLEKELVAALGMLARFPGAFEGPKRGGRALLFRPLSVKAVQPKEAQDAKIDSRGRAPRDGTGASRNAGKAKLLVGKAKPAKQPRPNGRLPSPR